MKNYLPILVLLIFCFACSKFTSLENTKTSETTNKANNTVASNKTNRPANQESTPKTESPLVALKKMKGKYQYEIKLWAKPEISQRLEKLMGKDHATMKKFWNVESPLEVEGDVLRLTGCEAHNCGANQYEIFMDTENDNINVYHILDESMKSYKEKGEIKLPKKMAEEFEQDTYNIKNK